MAFLKCFFGCIHLWRVFCTLCECSRFKKLALDSLACMKKCGIGDSSGFDRLKSVKLNARNRLSVQILFFRAYSMAEFKVKKAAFTNMSVMSVIFNLRISIDVFLYRDTRGISSNNS